MKCDAHRCKKRARYEADEYQGDGVFRVVLCAGCMKKFTNPRRHYDNRVHNVKPLPKPTPKPRTYTYNPKCNCGGCRAYGKGEHTNPRKKQ